MVTLYEHQQRIVDRALREKKLAVFAHPGTGKTITMLELFRRRPMRTLVLGPKTVIQTAWQNDAERMGMTDFLFVVSSLRNRIARIENLRIECESRHDPWMLAMGFEMYQTIEREVMAFFKPVRLIVDESSRLKNPTSKTSKALIAVADRCEEVYALSGTPAPNGPEEYWGQLRFIDKSPGGAASNGIFGAVPVFHSWAFRYLHPVRAMKPIAGRGMTSVIDSWKVKDADRFGKMLSSRAEVVRKEDCLDLPEKLDRTIKVKLGRDEWSAYMQLEADARVSLKDAGHHEFAVQAVAMKIRQVTGGGFIGEDKEFRKVGESKMEVLRDLVGETLAGEPLVIWCEFRSEVARISAMLDSMKIDYAIADGDHDSTTSVRQFVAGGVTVLIANSQSVGHGVTLIRCGEKDCRHAIYYSLSWSSERYEQSRDRLHRIGQRSDVTYWHLVASDSIDETIYDALSRKMSIQAAVLARLKHGSGNESRSGEAVLREAVRGS